MIRALTHVEALQFINAISYSPTSGFRSVAQVTEAGRIIAAVGYDHWAPNSVQMHIWIPVPERVSKSFFTEGFKYPFVTCGRGLVVGITPSNNAAALHFNRRVGFTEVYRMRDGWEPGVDFVVQEMRKENCRWLRSKHELVFETTEAIDKDSRPGGRAAEEVYRRVVRRPDELVQ